MAWHDRRNQVDRTCATGSACRKRTSSARRKLGVRDGGARRDLPHHLPRRLLERTAVLVHRQVVHCTEVTREVRRQRRTERTEVVDAAQWRWCPQPCVLLLRRPEPARDQHVVMHEYGEVTGRAG